MLFASQPVSAYIESRVFASQFANSLRMYWCFFLRDIGEDLDPAQHKLLRRIWWVIYVSYLQRTLALLPWLIAHRTIRRLGMCLLLCPASRMHAISISQTAIQSPWQRMTGSRRIATFHRDLRIFSLQSHKFSDYIWLKQANLQPLVIFNNPSVL